MPGELDRQGTADSAPAPRISFAVFQSTWEREVPMVVREHEQERQRVRVALGLPLGRPGIPE